MTRRILHRRFVALGDSFTEGMGDPDPSLPNGVRGWADRVAEQLSLNAPGFQYANFAIRGKRLEHVVAEQLEPALALRPDLVAMFAGINDLMHLRVHVNELMTSYEAAVARITATGARVVVFTICDPDSVLLFRVFRGRVAIYNELVREIARRHDATVVDLWSLRALTDRRMWGDDRLHLATPGHEVVAREVCEVLGIEHRLPAVEPTTRVRRVGRVTWLLRHALPWIVRRTRGTSLGDGLRPRFPELTLPVLPDDLGVATSLSGCSSDVTSPSATPSPKVSVTPTLIAPTVSEGGPIALPPLSPETTPT